MDVQNSELTTDEAKELIEMLKKALVDAINLPDGNQRKIEFVVEGIDKPEKFIISIFTGKINPQKHNFVARISRNGTPILELHLYPNAPHINPDGTKIVESHWHIHDQKYGRKMAYPASDITSDDFVTNTLLFLEKFHVVEKPTIQYQPALPE